MITSIKNDKVKEWKKLHKRKGRIQTGTFLIEGFHLMEEARKSSWKIREIIVEEDIDLPISYEAFPVERVTRAVFKEISQTESPQGIAAVVEMNRQSKVIGEHILLIDSVQDPGNLGTIIRTADAAGIDSVILGRGTVDLYNDKVIRASQGSIFHIPINVEDLLETIPRLKEDNYEIWVSALKNAQKYNEVPLSNKIALVLGNEGSGVNPAIINSADKIVKIPIYGKAESLNVSIAAGILMYYLKG
ncbi:RNA methyltransferase [Oceanobacillus piezotolerans]|uniref:RNA methyltransferase n=1 Tax=Oceanobacillus piezotolerans TaxID=2448030 RepID=A0A498DSD4_9BACI|nr:RNA methyltransferase [Oceanobacillus piezotolerans]RLL47917.1 RNA methyltransferase [Oceanobacillus piezotolerans]